MSNSASAVRTIDDPPHRVDGVGTLLRQLVVVTDAESVVVCGNAPAAVPLAEALREYGRGQVVAWAGEEGRDGRPVLPGPVDLVVLVGDPERFLALLRAMEPRLLPGAVVVACGGAGAAERAADFLAHVRAPGSGYVSQPLALDDGVEMAVRSA
ncbi:hypothetical protein ABZ990_24880 [Streptomyces sp. NPDC046203]|uniref:hypothetical protein n=1 Tax=Streptomyces sp. NPDC046203 TaxID=3154602 RepID=UPI0033EA1AD2